MFWQQTAVIIFDQTLRPYKIYAAFYEAYIKLAPNYAFIYMPLAIIAYNQTQKPQAQYYLKRMMELAPNQPIYPYHEAVILLYTEYTTNNKGIWITTKKTVQFYSFSTIDYFKLVHHDDYLSHIQA